MNSITRNSTKTTINAVTSNIRETDFLVGAMILQNRCDHMPRVIGGGD